MRTSAGTSSKRALRLFLLAVLLFITACAAPRQETRQAGGYAVASWYGRDFHGRPTASGEIYNMYDFSCAHRTLPFGTRLAVTNPANGRSTEVVVNDRGPFVDGRDIDLSYAAAKEIGLIGPGTGRVRLRYLGRDARYVKYIKELENISGPFTIQVGSFVEPSNARRLRKGLELNYGGVYISRASVGGREFYRVRVGKFSTRRQALGRAEVLANEGYDTLIMHHE
jgi:rare lipoprotein A